MTRILVINGPDYNWDKSSPIVKEILDAQPDLSCMLADDKSILASEEMASFDAVLVGSCLMRRVGDPRDPGVTYVQNFSDAEAEGLLSFVRNGKGFIGVHTAAWSVGGQWVLLVGGNCHMHPPRTEEPFTVNIVDHDHSITKGLEDFQVTDDEIYISMRDPSVHVLAQATWGNWRHAMAWTHSYGDGRVFYTSLGHGPRTFQNPAFQQLLIGGVRWAANR
jgi:type 1 glutamine amidotransferase